MENTFVFTDEDPCIILKYSKLIIKSKCVLLYIDEIMQQISMENTVQDVLTDSPSRK